MFLYVHLLANAYVTIHVYFIVCLRQQMHMRLYLVLLICVTLRELLPSLKP